MDINQVLGVITDSLKEYGVSMIESADSVKTYAFTRAKHLAAIIGEAGWFEAAEAEAHAVLLYAAGVAIDDADNFDAKLLGIVQGVLITAAKVIL